MTMNASKCVFHYKDTQNQGFQFEQCESKGFTIDDWASCLQECCQGMSYWAYSPSMYALEVCLSLNQGPFSLISTLAIPLACVIALLLVLFFCLFNHYRHIKKPIHDEEREVTSVEWPEEKGEFSNYLNTLKWSSNARKEEGLPDETDGCSICLEDSPAAELACRHCYHKNCLGQWLKKSSCCPCCRLDSMRGIKIYCQRCRWRCQVCTRSLLTTSYELISPTCSVCQSERREQRREDLMPANSWQWLMVGQSKLLKMKIVLKDVEQMPTP